MTASAGHPTQRRRRRAREDIYREAERALWHSLGVGPRECRVHLAGLGSEVRVQELGDGPPVLFLHGASTSGTSWASLVALLPDCRCLIVDRPGTGLSDVFPGPIADVKTLIAVARGFVPDLLDGLGLDAAPVVATSFGGLFAFHGALAAPARVPRIVEFGWPAVAPLGRMPWAMRLGSLPLLGSLSTRLPVDDRMVRAMFRRVGLHEAIDAGRVSQQAIGAYRALLNETDTLRNELTLGRAFVSPWRGLDRGLILSEQDRASIRQPVRFIWGDRDAFGGIDIARRFADPFPDARLEVVAGAGHSPWMDDPELAAELTRAALTD